jgi:hypothetical protein
MVRSLPLAVTLLAAMTPACEDDPADPRFATPEATIQTLLGAYGVEDMTQEQIQAHMRARGRFELRDEATYRACFVRFTGPEDEGLAGFVFGTIASGKDQLRIARVDDQVHVFPNPDRRDRYVLLVERDEGWKIDLEASVPSEIRSALQNDYARVQKRNARTGAPE